ncbi:hypothetical protein ACFQ0O_21085 [Saccharopolyspora spinosporotrichia]
MEERAAARGQVLARSTLAGVLGGKRLPRPELLAVFLHACGRGDEVPAWLRARDVLAERRCPTAQANPLRARSRLPARTPHPVKRTNRLGPSPGGRHRAGTRAPSSRSGRPSPSWPPPPPPGCCCRRTHRARTPRRPEPRSAGRRQVNGSGCVRSPLRGCASPTGTSGTGATRRWSRCSGRARRSRRRRRCWSRWAGTCAESSGTTRSSARAASRR